MWRGDEETIGVLGEVGPAGASGGTDQIRFAALGRDPDEVEPGGRSEIDRVLDVLAPWCAEGDDPLTVERPDRVAIEGGRLA